MIWTVTKYPLWFIAIVSYGYWIHRAYHYFPWLWRFHAVHHREFSFNFHPVESFLNWIVPFFASVPVMGTPFCLVALGIILFESNRGHGGMPGIKIPKKMYTGWVTRGYHKQHHLNPSVNYDQVTTWWDSIMGTTASRDKILETGLT